MSWFDSVPVACEHRPVETAPSSAHSVKVRTALVTGANRSLGFETCRELRRRGFHVILTSRDGDKGRAAARELAREGLTVDVYPLDVSELRSIADLAGHLHRSGVVLDVIVNNAGILLDGGTVEVARRTLATNFFGALAVTDALVPLVPPGGHVVMVSSTQGELSCLSPSRRAQFADAGLTREGLIALMHSFVADVARGRLGHPDAGWPPSSSAYRVSKVGMNALVRVLAREFAGRGIRVNAVCPGWVRTMGGPDAERSVEEGTASIVSAAAPADGPTGGFFRDGEPLPW